MPVKKSRRDEVIHDEFVQSRSVRSLVKNNFTKLLGNKEQVAMVMFYDPDCIYCQSAKPHFLKAAKTTVVNNRLFAAVDCTKEEQLCEMEDVDTFPTFKMYIGGKFFTKYSQPPNFVNMRNFVEKAPVDNHIDGRVKKNDMIYAPAKSL